MFLTITAAVVFFCVLFFEIHTFGARAEIANFTKILNEAKLNDSYVLETRCSGTSECALLHCARLCGSDELCVSLGYGASDRTCVHYTAHASRPPARMSAVSQSGWDTWEKYTGPGPCDEGGHVTLQEGIRSVADNTGSTLQDFTLAEGWYRFVLHGVPATIPTTCRTVRYYCGSYFPMWLDLQGASLPGEDEELVTRACGGGNPSSCCEKPRPVTVWNCGSFFVYKLVATEDHNYNYCTQ